MKNKVIVNKKEYWVLVLEVEDEYYSPPCSYDAIWLVPVEIKPEDLNFKILKKGLSNGILIDAHKYLKKLGAIPIADLALITVSEEE